MPIFKLLISRTEYRRGYIELEAKDEDDIFNKYYGETTENIDYDELNLIDASDEILSIENISMEEKVNIKMQQLGKALMNKTKKLKE